MPVPLLLITALVMASSMPIPLLLMQLSLFLLYAHSGASHYSSGYSIPHTHSVASHYSSRYSILHIHARSDALAETLGDVSR